MKTTILLLDLFYESFTRKQHNLRSFILFTPKGKWNYWPKWCWAADSRKVCKGPVRVNQAQWGGDSSCTVPGTRYHRVLCSCTQCQKWRLGETHSRQGSRYAACRLSQTFLGRKWQEQSKLDGYIWAKVASEIWIFLSVIDHWVKNSSDVL